MKKPNGDQYAADSIFYLVLGIQEYLFEVNVYFDFTQIHRSRNLYFIMKLDIFYLILKQSQIMYKFSHITLDQNGRIDNIFTDTYYDPFTSALHEVVKDFKLPVRCITSWITGYLGLSEYLPVTIFNFSLR